MVAPLVDQLLAIDPESYAIIGLGPKGVRATCWRRDGACPACAEVVVWKNRIWRIIAPFKGNGWIDSGQKTFGIGSVTIEAQPILASQPTGRGQFAWVKQTIVIAVQARLELIWDTVVIAVETAGMHHNCGGDEIEHGRSGFLRSMCPMLPTATGCR